MTAEPLLNKIAQVFAERDGYDTGWAASSRPKRFIFL